MQKQRENEISTSKEGIFKGLSTQVMFKCLEKDFILDL